MKFSEQPLTCAEKNGALLMTFAPGTVLEIKAGFSYIDCEQAAANLDKETSRITFDDAANCAQEIWDKTLGRIEAEGGTEQQKRVFYTSLYRVRQRMIDISEYGRSYSPFDGRVHTDPVPFYTNDGLWDTYRTAHPLQLLLEPERQRDIISSYIRMCEHSGWMPSFPALYGSRPVMIGKHATSMIADAYLKGLDGFDIEKAREAMVKNEEEPTKLPWAFGLVSDFDRCYFEKGFFPSLPDGEKETLEGAHSFERRQCVSVTLETCYDEFCLARIAEKLGKNGSTGPL